MDTQVINGVELAAEIRLQILASIMISWFNLRTIANVLYAEKAAKPQQQSWNQQSGGGGNYAQQRQEQTSKASAYGTFQNDCFTLF